MNDINVETKSSEVVDMTGKVLSSHTEIKMTREKKGTKPDKQGSALLQARHVVNEAQDITDEIKKLGYDTGKSYIQDSEHRIIKIHYYAWGLFQAVLNRALKDRKDLREWSPETFDNEIICADCNGNGETYLDVSDPTYEKVFEEYARDAKDWGDPEPVHGMRFTRYCSPCQGCGYLLLKG